MEKSASREFEWPMSPLAWLSIGALTNSAISKNRFSRWSTWAVLKDGSSLDASALRRLCKRWLIVLVMVDSFRVGLVVKWKKNGGCRTVGFGDDPEPFRTFAVS